MLLRHRSSTRVKARNWHVGFLEGQTSLPGRADLQLTSPLIVGGERILSEEFREEARARQVLATLGSDERTFTTGQ